MFKVKVFQGSHASTKIFYLEFFYKWNIFCRKISKLRYIHLVSIWFVKAPPSGVTSTNQIETSWMHYNYYLCNIWHSKLKQGIICVCVFVCVFVCVCVCVWVLACVRSCMHTHLCVCVMVHCVVFSFQLVKWAEATMFVKKRGFICRIKSALLSYNRKFSWIICTVVVIEWDYTVVPSAWFWTKHQQIELMYPSLQILELEWYYHCL